MRRLPQLVVLALLCISCAGKSFDEATIPAEQRSAELAFKRVAVHGGMEAVLEENQEFKDWQFHISSKSKTSVLNNEPVETIHLRDRSGITYTVTSSSTPISVLDQLDLGYGYASGKVMAVNRDLANGKIEAELSLTSWRERSH